MRALLAKSWRRIRQSRINRRERAFIREVMRTNGIPDAPCDGEAAWLDRWGSLYPSVSPCYLRCFSAFLTEGRERIVPGEVCANLVEPLLNPVRYRSYYEDKNVYGQLFDRDDLPLTYLRRMEGKWYDAAYRPCRFPEPEALLRITSGAEKLIVKPTIDTESGRGVLLFRLDAANGRYTGSGGEAFGCEGGGDLIVQECVEQHPFTAQFNPTSVNSFRMIVYRSPEDGRIEVLHTILKAGAGGSHVDNLHAGGGLIGVRRDGTLAHCVYTLHGERSERINGVDLRNTFVVPNYEALQEFARRIARRLLHSHLSALDVMLDRSGRPRLIECNIKAFGYWAPQFCTGPAFGDATDEIIAWTRERLGDLKYTVTL